MKELNQHELAKTLRVSQQMVSHWEQGKITPSPKMQKKIAKYFGVTVEDLMRDTGKEKPMLPPQPPKVKDFGDTNGGVRLMLLEEKEKLGITYAEIGKRLDMPEENARRKLGRGALWSVRELKRWCEVLGIEDYEKIGRAVMK